jgi:hypothetical protein
MQTMQQSKPNEMPGSKVCGCDIMLSRILSGRRFNVTFELNVKLIVRLGADRNDGNRRIKTKKGCLGFYFILKVTRSRKMSYDRLRWTRTMISALCEITTKCDDESGRLSVRLLIGVCRTV